MRNKDQEVLVTPNIINRRENERERLTPGEISPFYAGDQETSRKGRNF
jgi:hypothetical protein